MLRVLSLFVLDFLNKKIELTYRNYRNWRRTMPSISSEVINFNFLLTDANVFVKFHEYFLYCGKNRMYERLRAFEHEDKNDPFYLHAQFHYCKQHCSHCIAVQSWHGFLFQKHIEYVSLGSFHSYIFSFSRFVLSKVATFGKPSGTSTLWRTYFTSVRGCWKLQIMEFFQCHILCEATTKNCRLYCALYLPAVARKIYGKSFISYYSPIYLIWFPGGPL